MNHQGGGVPSARNPSIQQNNAGDNASTASAGAIDLKHLNIRTNLNKLKKLAAKEEEEKILKAKKAEEEKK